MIEYLDKLISSQESLEIILLLFFLFLYKFLSWKSTSRIILLIILATICNVRSVFISIPGKYKNSFMNKRTRYSKTCFLLRFWIQRSNIFLKNYFKSSTIIALNFVYQLLFFLSTEIVHILCWNIWIQYKKSDNSLTFTYYILNWKYPPNVIYHTRFSKSPVKKS